MSTLHRLLVALRDRLPALATSAYGQSRRLSGWSLTALQNLIAYYRVLPGPDFVPGPGVATLPPYGGPILGSSGLPVRFPAAGAMAATAVTPVRYDPAPAPEVQPIY